MKLFNPFKRSPLLKEFFEDKYKPQRLLQGSPKTVRVYYVTFDMLERYLGKPARLSDLNDETLAEFAKWRLYETKVKAATVARDMVCIKALWRFARDVGLVKYGPTVKTLQASQPAPLAYCEEQLDAIHQAVLTEDRPVLVSTCDGVQSFVPGPDWWLPLFFVFWDTAERFGAVFDLKEEDCDLEAGCVCFPAETRKGRRHDNFQRIEPRTVEAIEHLLSYYPRRQANSRIFRFASNHGTIYARWGRILDRAGVPNPHGKKFHLLRSSRATHEHLAGGDATAKLTHSSDAITRKSYLDPKLIAKRAETIQVYQPGMLPKKAK